MKLAICGDSFSAISTTKPHTHWSELLSEQLGWDLVNWARRGCSNGGIRLQIEQAIQDRVDFVFVVPTSWDRIEIPSQGVSLPGTVSGKGWANSLQQFLLDKKNYQGYDRSKVIQNINYHKDQTSPLIAETIFSLAENYEHEYRSGRLNTDAQKAMKQYINHLYDSAWKQQMDQWIIIQGVTKLYDSGIPFSIEKGMLWNTQEEFERDIPKLLPPHSVRQGNETVAEGCHRFPLQDKDKDPGYHSEPEAQVWLADLYRNIINKQYKI